MQVRALLVAATALLLLLSAPAAANLRFTATLEKRHAVDLGTFGFAEGGAARIVVSAADLGARSIYVSDGAVAGSDSFGLVLDRVRSSSDARLATSYANRDSLKRRLCYNTDPELRPARLKARPDAAVRFDFPLNRSPNTEKTLDANIVVRGVYALVFYNCLGFNKTAPGSTPGGVPVSFTVTAEMTNMSPAGGRSFLNAGDRPLPIIFGLFAIVFMTMTALWVLAMRRAVNHNQRVHYLMMVLVVLKTLSLLCESFKFSHYAASGYASGWDTLYYLFLGTKGTTLFAVVVLLGTGWSVLKPTLSANEMMLLKFIIPCQVLVNVLLAVVEESSVANASWEFYAGVLQVLDVVCCVAVLLPIVWSMNRLRDAAEGDERAQRSVARMRMFRIFYIIVVAFIYFTRIVTPALDDILPFDMTWIAAGLREVAAVAFYTYAGMQFRPGKENPYLYVGADDMGELAAREEAGVV